MKKTFYCASCQRDQSIKQIGKITQGNHSKRCQSCCDKADAQRAALATGSSQNKGEFSAFADEMKRLELGRF
jgi:transposase-like protein